MWTPPHPLCHPKWSPAPGGPPQRRIAPGDALPPEAPSPPPTTKTAPPLNCDPRIWPPRPRRRPLRKEAASSAHTYPHDLASPGTRPLAPCGFGTRSSHQGLRTAGAVCKICTRTYEFHAQRRGQRRVKYPVAVALRPPPQEYNPSTLVIIAKR